MHIGKGKEMDPPPPRKGTKIPFRNVRVPVALLDRIEAIYEVRGYATQAEYIRAAIQKQLASDEAKE